MSHKFMRLLALALLTSLTIVAAASAQTPTPGSTPAATTAPNAGPTATKVAGPTNTPNRMVPLTMVAKQEGQVSLIGVSHNECGYPGVLDGFKAQYGLKVNELSPEASSNDQIDAIKANLDNSTGQAPDVINVSMLAGQAAKTSALLQPYKQDFAGLAGKWDRVPAASKDADGNWYGIYYGVFAFEVNTDVVKTPPQDWADLLKPDYKNAVALAGDPRVADDAMLAVYAAGLGSGGTAENAGQTGLDFFAKLTQAGNLVPTLGNSASLAKGDTPIIIRLDYLALADRDALNGKPNVAVVIPKSAVVADVRAQAISAYAPHPMAAKLWEEYMVAPAGQLLFMKGYCHPISFDTLMKNNQVPADVLAKFPPMDAYANTVFPTLDQQSTANAVIAKNWDSVVGVNLK